MKIFVRLKLVLVLNIVILGCQPDNHTIESIHIHDGYYSEKYLQLEEINRIELDHQDYMIRSFFVTPNKDAYLFDRSFGLIYKVDKNGHILNQTGGIGRGPGEFLTDNFISLIYCGIDKFIAIDWTQARFQVFDLDLNLLNIVNLNSVSYDLSCVNDDKLAALYVYSSKIDIINYDGILHDVIEPDVPFGVNKENVFRHFTYISENRYALSYLFKPVHLIINRAERSQKEFILSKLDYQNVVSAVRNVNVLKNELHLFYNNINQDLPEREQKVSHVFNMDDGEYQYSYRIPERINNYHFISDNRLAAMEDSMRTVTLYNFKIDHNEPH